jgi:hypothetical protein
MSFATGCSACPEASFLTSPYSPTFVEAAFSEVRTAPALCAGILM